MPTLRERYSENLGDTNYIGDAAKIDAIEHGRLLRTFAGIWFSQYRQRLQTAVFDAKGKYPRYGVFTWRELESELWVAALEKAVLGRDPGYIRTVLHNRLKRAMRDGDRRYHHRAHPLQMPEPTKEYDDEGNQVKPDLLANMPTESRVWDGGYLTGYKPKAKSLKRQQQRRRQAEKARMTA